MEVRDETINLLCMACLCVGRTLKKITDEKLKQYYMDTLNEIPLCITSLVPVVCWECEAMLRKVLAFKEQVKDSYRILQTYTKEHSCMRHDHEVSLLVIMAHATVPKYRELNKNKNLHECLLSEVGRPPRLKVHNNNTIVIPEHNDALPNVKYEKSSGERLYINSQSSEESKREIAEIVTVLCDKKQNLQECPLSDVKRPSRFRHRSEDVDVDDGLEVKIERNEDKRLRTDSLSSEQSKVEEIVTVLCDVKKQKSRRKEGHVKAEKNGLDVLNIEECDVDKCESPEDQSGGSDNDDVHSEERNRSDSDGDENVGKFKVKKKRASLRTKIKEVKKKNNDKNSKKELNLKIKTLELSYEDMQAERTRRAQRKSFVDAQHKCKTCLLVFNCAATHRAHDKSKHSPELGEYICPICYIIVSTVESFTAHYKRHIRRYECGVCQKRTLDVKTMNRHLYTRHGKSTKQYKCEKMSKERRPDEYRDRRQGRVQCADCEKTFSHRAGLMNHRLAVHESQNEFPCSVCDKVFRWKTSLKRHLEKHQTKSPSGGGSGGAYCFSCDIGFSSVCSLQRHLRNSLKHVTQDQLKFICEHCSRRFADKTKLRNHIEEKHLHFTYSCHICGKPSKNRVGLEQHVRNVHKGRPNNKICHHCGKGFPTKVQLESHIRTHTGERPFICEFCPTTFSQQSNLYKHHRQVHLNIKSKRYPLCKKKRSDGNQTGDPQASDELPVPPLLYYENILGV